MKLRNLLITLGLTLTVGAGVAVATSAKQNEEPKAAEAASVSKSRIVLELEDQCYSTDDGRNPILHMWNISVDSTMEYDSSDIAGDLDDSGAIADFPTGAANVHRINNDGSIDTGFTKIKNDGNKRYWSIYLPWYITGFTFKMNCGSYWASSELNVTGRGSHMVYNYGSWYSWDNSLVQGTSSLTNTYDVDNYAISTAKSGGGSSTAQVKGNSGSYTTSGSYFPRQKISLKATAASGYSFSSWSAGNDTSSATTYDFVGTAGKTYTATFTAATYTITYDRNNNGASSPTATRTKSYDVAHTILNPTTFSWSPTTDKRFVRWDTARDDSGTDYAIGDSYTTNAPLTLYYIEDWYNYRVSINGGTPVDLTHNDSGKPDGVKVQFSSPAISLPAGGTIAFEYSTNGGSTWSSLTIDYWDGNYDGSAIEMTTFDTIFLKLEDDGDYVVYIPGESERTILITDSATGTSGTSYAMVGTSSTETVTIVSVYIEKGQYVRRCYAGTTYNTYYSGGTYSENTDDCFENITGYTAVLCTVTGVYTVKNFDNGDAQWWNIWVERHDELSAGFLAQKFNSTISAICSAVTGGTKGLSDLQAAWGSNSSSALHYHFNGQPSDTMDYFATNAITTNTDILACVAKYDYIVKKYGTTALPDFLGRGNGYTENGQQSHLMISLFGQSGGLNSSIIVIVVIASLGLLSVGGYYFFRKSRKTEE